MPWDPKVQIIYQQKIFGSGAWQHPIPQVYCRLQRWFLNMLSLLSRHPASNVNALPAVPQGTKKPDIGHELYSNQS